MLQMPLRQRDHLEQHLNPPAGHAVPRNVGPTEKVDPRGRTAGEGGMLMILHSSILVLIAPPCISPVCLMLLWLKLYIYYMMFRSMIDSL